MEVMTKCSDDLKSVSNRTAKTFEQNMLVIFDTVSKNFTYPANMGDIFAGSFDGRPLCKIMLEDGFASENTADTFKNQLESVANASSPQVIFSEYILKCTDDSWKWFNVGFVLPVPGGPVNITFTNINNIVNSDCHGEHVSSYDELTGLLNRDAFCDTIECIMRKNQSAATAGEYALIYFDVLRFKAVNDLFGMSEGDRLLRHIADTLSRSVKEEDVVCRPGSDRFIVFTHTWGNELLEFIERLLSDITGYNIPFQITCNAGIYVTNGSTFNADSMIDRAVLAQSSIKGSFTKKYNFYTESLRNDMLGEQEIVGMMSTALEEKHFVVYYQPQYNHSTGMLLGAEALVRWKHPEKGLISPGVFIPIFEKNGFITKLDLYVFEEVCVFLKKCIDKGTHIVPISSNFSRHDIFQPDFVEKLEEIRCRYEVPVKYLRIEITESAVMGNSELINEVVKKLHGHGYIVEMDDFGSGYSSLNVLKDIELDVIKLDMLFMKEQSNNSRGGTILSSVVRMAKWLDMPVIAEGVENVNQADFLRSIGCDYIQGYLYSRPVPEEEYEQLISGSSIGTTVPQMKLIDTLNAGDFWNPTSQETLIFNNYVGGAAVFDYHDGVVEVLRVNSKYLQELGMNLSEKDLINGDPFRFFDEDNKKIYIDMLNRAIETMDEQECETWRDITSCSCGSEKMCIRTIVRLIGKSDGNYLFYATIRNITSEKERYEALIDSERRFNMASEHANIYYWEYTIATKEMRPCFRCMRDLGLPALVRNYPDPLFENGIFPPEVSDMYYDWMKQIENGVEELEAVIPLTVGRVPFRVKYTTEFDSNGNPVKAYGSATLIVE